MCNSSLLMHPGHGQEQPQGTHLRYRKNAIIGRAPSRRTQGEKKSMPAGGNL